METPSALLSLTRRLRFGAALLALAGSNQAVAQQAPAYALSKASLILGGAPSRLQMLMAAQSGATATPQTAILNPAAAPRIDPALVRSAVLTDVASAPVGPMAADLPPVSADLPNVFGSVALDIGHTPLDARYAAVVHGSEGRPARRFAIAERSASPLDRLAAVNAYVNRRVTFTDDRVQYGVDDFWATGAQTLAHGRGDCEDYAIAKLEMLRDAGFADHDLILVIVRDLTRRADHAVLVVRASGRFLVLDNGTDRLVDATEIHDFRPVFSFTAGHRYLHGFRREAMPVPVTYASADPVPTPQPATDQSDTLASTVSIAINQPTAL